MADQNPNEAVVPHQNQGGNSTTDAFLENLTTRLTQILTQNQTNPPPPASTPQNDSSSSHIAIKLDGANYGLWSQVVEMYIAGKDKLGYINGDLPQPLPTDPGFRRWKTEDSTVKGWLINSMDPALIGNFIRFPTAKTVWDSVATTFFDGTDASQVYDLKRRVARLKQAGGPIEKYYNDLQGLWREIDFRRPNPMSCPIDIERYNTAIQEDRVYIFLDGLDDRLDKVRADVLQMQPFPTVEQAYARIRREDVRQSVMLSNGDAPSSAAAMVSHGRRTGPRSLDVSLVPQTLQSTPLGAGINAGFKHKPPPTGGCTHCGNPKHTKETCFKLNGYPDWWKDLQAKKKNELASSGGKGRVLLTTGDSPLSLVPQVDSTSTSTSTPEGNYGCVFVNTHQDGSSGWIIDSGATDHMTPNSDDFICHTTPRRQSIYNANGRSYPVIGAGSVALTPSLSLSHTLLVPSLSNRLLSVGQVTEELNCSVLMYPEFCLFQDILTKEIIGRGTKREGLYYVDDLTTGRVHHTRGQTTNREKEIWLWHRRLGHPSFGYLKYLFPELFKGLSNSTFQCETCILAKSHRVPFPLSFNKSTTPFVLIHSDVWGASPITTVSGIRWFVTFVDDCTRMTWLYLMKHKDEVSTIFRVFHRMIETQFGAQLRVLRTDNGGEYVNQNLAGYFQEHGLIHETSCAQTPQQNGIAERKNRHILETARALLRGGHIPTRFWDAAVITAVHLMNRMPSRVLNFKTPLQVLSTHIYLPSVLTLPPKVFGCVAYVHLHKNQWSKLDPCAVRCVFLGYGTHQKGYRCYNPATKKTHVTMDVTFVESEFFFPDTNCPFQGEIHREREHWWESGSGGVLAGARVGFDSLNSSAAKFMEDEHQASVADDQQLAPKEDDAEQSQEHPSLTHDIPSLVPDHSPEDTPEVRSPVTADSFDDSDAVVRYKLPDRYNRGKPPIRYSPDIEERRSRYPITNYVSTERLSESLKAFVSNVSTNRVPNGVQEALRDPKWVQAMKEEMEALHKNKTWSLVELPKGKKTVGCKWVFTIKYKADGSIERNKARLVAKGYTQTYGVDYQETFSPVAKLNTVRVLLSLAANLDWPLHQFDVKNAFLHGDLEEEIYMEVPPGYNCVAKPNVVCKLERALYGLKQSPRAWFGRFSSAMRRYGYFQSNSDHTLFLKRHENKVTILIIYVDDMIITGDDLGEISRLQEKLAEEFEMKNLGGLKYFLGIEVARSKGGIFLSQRKYVLDLLAEVGMLECKPADTPMIQNHKLGVYPDQVPTNKERYQRLVGRLIYLSHTRPDIAYAVSVVSQFMHAPSEDHWNAVIRILRYLKSSPGKGIFFAKNDHLEVEGFTDADWAGSISDRKSTSGYFTFVGGNLVTWRSKKQKVVALSSAEAEFRGVAKGLCELLWLKRLMTELGFPPKSEMRLFCDNKAAIDISHNPVQHDRTKHVEVDRHFVKQNLDAKVVRFPFVRSEDQLADILTKAVSSTAFHSSLVKLGIKDIFSPT